MQKKQCPNGHIYDPSIYGDSCPLCPAGTQPPVGAYDNTSPKTHLAGGATPPPSTPGGFGAAPDLKTQIGGGFGGGFSGNTVRPGGQAYGSQNDAAGKTKVRPDDQNPAGAAPQHTTIRRGPIGKGGMSQVSPERRLVGFLVTYNRHPAGKAFNLYEGRNYLGRDASCDISMPDDGQMSGKHMSILYRAVDGKFKFRDEQSSNGTFINNELLDDGELKNYDIIRAGGTNFIFIAIPKLV